MKTTRISKLLVVMLINVAIAVCTLPIAVAADAPRSLGKVDEQCLMGRWLRPDGGYVIDIRGVQAEGNLDAAYFNPATIHVARAEWELKDGAIAVFVELRDVNYPGSTYTLQYDPASDRLVGIYYQAAMQQQFEVEFIRE
jgi:hypothetical protein